MIPGFDRVSAADPTTSAPARYYLIDQRYGLGLQSAILEDAKLTGGCQCPERAALESGVDSGLRRSPNSESREDDRA